MTNLKTIFKQKSKLLLIVLSLLGMLFSYSCSCRNNSTAPNTPEDTQTNNTNAFIPIASKIYNATNSALIASENGTQKTHIKIKFDEANHTIKNATLKKMVDTNGNDLTTKATYSFADLSLGFVASDLEEILKNMDSKTAPATNELTLTFELTTDSKTSTNTTATVENVKLQIIKTQKFGDDATILQNIFKGLGNDVRPSTKVKYDFTSAGLNLVEMEATMVSEGTKDISVKDDLIDELINNNSNAISKNEDYKKYFEDIKPEDGYNDNVDGTSSTLTLKFVFTPKNIYDMSLTTYTTKFDNKTYGNFKK